MDYHRLHEIMPDPIAAPMGGEIRFPEYSGSHNLRARKELNEDEKPDETR